MQAFKQENKLRVPQALFIVDFKKNSGHDTQKKLKGNGLFGRCGCPQPLTDD